MSYPLVMHETLNGFTTVSPETKLLMRDRILVIDKEIDVELASNICNLLMVLDDDEQPITIILNTPGGMVHQGNLIYDVIQGLRSPVNVVCMGMAYSMGAILLAGGRRGRRFIFPLSKVMIHEPLINGGLGGSATSISQVAGSILETKKQLVEILSKHTGKSLKEVEKAISYDHYFDAKEAIEFGLCDHIVTNIKEVLDYEQ